MAPSSPLDSILRLHWMDPSRYFSHGISGIATILLGACLIIFALMGELEAATHPVPLSLYVYAALANSLAGQRMTNRAPLKYRPIFRLCSTFQCCLVYFAFRFSQAFPFGGTYVAAAVDALVCSLLVLGIGAIATFGLLRLPLLIGIPVACGCLALSLLAGYPLQLAVFGEGWWACVGRAYAVQGAAMVAYIYVPATWAFALMLFGATLWLRRLIGDLALGCGFAGVVMTTLLATVLLQEVHYPEPLSTQRLWLPCPRPQPGSWSAWVEVHLDTSALARTALRALRVRP